VSRQVLIDSKFSTLICAPIFSNGQDLSTQVAIGPDEGLKHPSWIMCDNLISVRKAELSHFIAQLPPGKIAELDRALRMALSV
jgi:mRNA interferase MazF